MSVSCLDCGFVFRNEDHNDPCPKCGSQNRHITASDEGKSHELLKLRKKGLNSKKHNILYSQRSIAPAKFPSVLSLHQWADPSLSFPGSQLSCQIRALFSLEGPIIPHTGLARRAGAPCCAHGLAQRSSQNIVRRLPAHLMQS
jgi:hypothetical protein